MRRIQVRAPIKTSIPADYNKVLLLQLLVLRLGLLQDGDVGVGIFPQGEEIFIGGERAYAREVGICPMRSSRLQRVRPRYAEMRQSPRPAVLDDAAVVKNPRKLGGSRAALSGC